MRIKFITPFLMFALVLPGFSHTAWAQDDQGKADGVGEVQNADAGVEPDYDSKKCTTKESVRVQLEEMKKEITAQMRQERKEELEAYEEEQTLASFEEEEEDVDNKLLRIYGYFDVIFGKYFVEENSGYHLSLATDSTSFFMSGISMYLDSQMTDTLSALAEINFTFLPRGTEESLAYYVDGSQVPGSEYKRTNTIVRDPYGQGFKIMGGVTIDRLYVNWEPHDAFNVMLGRYLTPYGIWNTDHGSPVIIPIRAPYMMTVQHVPSAQTGMEVFGRFFPTSNLSLFYALTASNGAGPAESVYDIDENKALGLRLLFTYEKPKFTLALGGYGYYSHYTDTSKAVRIITTGDEAEMLVERNVVSEGDQFIGTLDVLIKVHGLRLQAEYAHERVYPSKNTPVGIEVLVYEVGEIDLSQERYFAAYTGHFAYALAGYELPLHKWFGQFRIMPYFMWEYFAPLDKVSWQTLYGYVAGLNLKPSPFIVIKAEWGVVLSPQTTNTPFAGTVHNLGAQIAVSF